MSYAIGSSPAVFNLHATTADVGQGASTFTRCFIGEATAEIVGCTPVRIVDKPRR